MISAEILELKKIKEEFNQKVQNYDKILLDDKDYYSDLEIQKKKALGQAESDYKFVLNLLQQRHRNIIKDIQQNFIEEKEKINEFYKNIQELKIKAQNHAKTIENLLSDTPDHIICYTGIIKELVSVSGETPELMLNLWYSPFIKNKDEVLKILGP